MFPGQEFIIVLEEGAILSLDLLAFFAQTFPALAKDDTLLSISAWNPMGMNLPLQLCQRQFPLKMSVEGIA